MITGTVLGVGARFRLGAVDDLDRTDIIGSSGMHRVDERAHPEPPHAAKSAKHDNTANSARCQQGRLTSAYGGRVPARRLVSTSELARTLGLSTRTIQRYRQEGLLAPDLVSLGGHARWDPDKVRAQLHELQQRPGE